MFDWLFEGNSTVYLLLGVAAVIMALAWYYNRTRPLLIAFLAAAALIGLYALLDVLVVTDGEQVNRNLHEMAKAVVERKPERLAQHLSQARDARFFGVDRVTLLAAAERAMQGWKIDEVVLWDYRVEEKKENTVRVVFQAKPKLEGLMTPYFRCEATFVREEGFLRMKTLRAFKDGTQEEVGLRDIP